jgi:hypothetical protein
MHFFRETQLNLCGGQLLQRRLRAPTVGALPSERRTAASMQSSARCFRDAGPLALIARDGMYAGFAGANASHEKITIFRGAL